MLEERKTYKCSCSRSTTVEKYFHTFRNARFTTHLTLARSPKRRLDIAASRRDDINEFLAKRSFEPSWRTPLDLSNRLGLHFCSSRNGIRWLFTSSHLCESLSRIHLSRDKSNPYMRIPYVIEMLWYRTLEEKSYCSTEKKSISWIYFFTISYLTIPFIQLFLIINTNLFNSIYLFYNEHFLFISFVSLMHS